MKNNSETRWFRPIFGLCNGFLIFVATLILTEIRYGSLISLLVILHQINQFQEKARKAKTRRTLIEKYCGKNLLSIFENRRTLTTIHCETVRHTLAITSCERVLNYPVIVLSIFMSFILTGMN